MKFWWLYLFKSSECNILFKNTGSLPIEFLEVTIDLLPESNSQKQIVQWEQKTILDQLPIAPGTTASLPLKLFGASNFLMQCSTLVGKNEFFKSRLHTLWMVYWEFFMTTETGSLKSSILSGPSSFPSLPSPKPTSGERSTLLSASTFSFRYNLQS